MSRSHSPTLHLRTPESFLNVALALMSKRWGHCVATGPAPPRWLADACTRHTPGRRGNETVSSRLFFFIRLRSTKMTGRCLLGPSPDCFDSLVSFDAAMHPR